MKQEEILKKVIEKAENNGWDSSQYIPAFPSKLIKPEKFNKVLLSQKEKIIFSHNFAKAFFGDKGTGALINYPGLDSEPIEVKEWHLHLQMMILEKDPIEYLEKFI